MTNVLINWKPLQDFTQAVFEGVGMSPADAAIEAEVLVWANLRGVDSHGVLRIPSYVESVEKGGMNPKAEYRVEKETPATVLIEADHAFGPVVTTFAMRRVIEKARAVGVGWGLIRNTTHQGAMAYYALMAAREGLAGLAVVCSPPNMAPTGARVPGVHNSPISIAVPTADHEPICLDMATSVAAGGKVQLARDKGVPLGEGWALDADGNPTRDAAAVGALLPAGGYKGYGLALMFECLASLMVGNPLILPTLSWRQDGRPFSIRPGTQNSFVMAVDIAAFSDLDAYRANADATIDAIKGLPRQDGVNEILVPGEIENRVYAQRRAEGIPLPEGTVANLRAVATKLDVPLPEVLT